MTKRRILVLGVGALLLAAGGAWLLLFTRFIQVPTGAMANTILVGDRLAVNRLASEIKRGDIITFKYPPDTSIEYIKRVIGLPGEKIQIRDTTVYINGSELRERRVRVALPSEEDPSLREVSSEGEGSYSTFWYPPEERLSTEELRNGLHIAAEIGAEPFTIPDGHYFVMGDNRDNSQDSRYWGTVPRELITGKAIFIYWSVERRNGADGADERIRWNRVFTKPK